MNDRELLELAAKALGHRYSANWEPLEDDGDALRLAVALRLEVYSPTNDDWRAFAVGSDGCEHWSVEEGGKDASAAVRRAIVTTAAKIGMQSNAALSGTGPAK